MKWQYEEELATVKADLERERAHYKTARDVADLAVAENEKLRRDAERYRWLRSAEPWDDPITRLQHFRGYCSDALDMAIDAALGSQPEGSQSGGEQTCEHGRLWLMCELCHRTHAVQPEGSQVAPGADCGICRGDPDKCDPHDCGDAALPPKEGDAS